MCGADDGIDVHYRHNPVAIIAVVGFKNPQAVVWVWISETLAEFMDERAFKHLLPKRERKE